tara:strand:- start:201 stop:494 length:294 start_codon:yes stop_codon:yes gene_type:complete
MSFKLGLNLASFDIPQEALVISRGSDDLLVIKESAARQETTVSIQLSGYFNGHIGAVEVENRAKIVQTTACNICSRRGVGNSHNPGRSKRNSVDFVC